MEFIIVGLAVLLVVAVFMAFEFRGQRDEARQDHNGFLVELEKEVEELKGAVERDSLKIQAVNTENRDLKNTILDMKQITNKDREQIIDLEDRLSSTNVEELRHKIKDRDAKIEIMAKAMGEDRAMLIRFEKMVDYERARVKRAQKKNRELRLTAKPKAKKKK